MRSSRIEEQMTKMIDSLAALRGDVRAVRLAIETGVAAQALQWPVEGRTGSLGGDKVRTLRAGCHGNSRACRVVWELRDIGKDGEIMSKRMTKMEECHYLTVLREAMIKALEMAGTGLTR